MSAKQDEIREFIKKKQRGGCKVLSEGDKCKCTLCEFDRLCKDFEFEVSLRKHAEERVEKMEALLSKAMDAMQFGWYNTNVVPRGTSVRKECVLVEKEYVANLAEIHSKLAIALGVKPKCEPVFPTDVMMPKLAGDDDEPVLDTTRLDEEE